MHKCKSCYSNNLESIIPLGQLPLANALTNHPELNCKKYNLEVMLCKLCGLAQLKDILDPKDLFSNYLYFSSNSETMLKYAKDLVDKSVKTLQKNSRVVEIASNDGYLLKNYLNYNINILGIEPAKNIAELANKNGIKTICKFFSSKLAKNLKRQNILADIIHANNVMAHIPDINDFIKGLKIILKPKGKAIIEVPYFLDLVKNLEFDTIYHEHVYYFALNPLVKAFKRNALHIYDLEKLPIHGGTLRLYIAHEGVEYEKEIIKKTILIEKEFGLFELETFVNFMKRLKNLKKELIYKLESIKSSGNSIAAYGASAKGTTLVNYFKIAEYLNFVVDRSPAKQLKFTPGASIKVKEPDSLLSENISYALLLVWNFADEVIEQQKDFLENGGKFILPLPSVRVIP